MGTVGGQNIRSISYYAIGNIARNVASVALLPLYTHYLLPADYGAIDILTLLTLSLSIVFGLDLGNGVFRHYCLADKLKDRQEIIGSAIIIALLSNTTAVVLLVAFSKPLAARFLGDSGYAYLLSLNALTLVFEGMGSIAATQIRANGNARLFLAVSLGRLVLQIGFNVLFVVVMGYGLRGMIYGSVLASAIVGLGLLPYSVRFSGFAMSKQHAVNLMRFGLPLAAANVATFYLLFGDRFFLSKYHGVAAVGIYALAWKIAQGHSLLIGQPFQQMWDAERYHVAKQDNPALVFARVFRLLAVTLVLSGLLLAVFATEALQLLASPSYSFAADVAPLLILGFILSGLNDYCRFGSLYSSNTLNVTIGAWLSAVVITIGFVCLIPPFGVYGAALASILGKLLQLTWEYRRAKLGYDMGLNWKPIVQLSIAAIACYVGCRYVVQLLPGSIPIKLALVSIFTALVWKSQLLATEDKALLYRLFRRFVPVRQT